MRLSVAEVETLRKGELETMGAGALAVGMLAVLFAVLAFIAGMLLAPALVGLLVLGSLFLGGMAMGLVVLTGIRKARGHPKAFTDWWSSWQEKLQEKPTPPTLPTTLPHENRIIPVTAGDRAVDLPLDLIHGFDERDLEFLCRQVARRNYTEEGMEKLELPYSHKVMGKAQPGTLYTLFMELCVAAGIIEGRAPKKSGTLAVASPDEMMRRLKLLKQE